MNKKIINSQEYRIIAILAGIFSLRMLGLFMVLPVFSLYAKQLTNSSAILVGLALGIYGLTQAVCQLGFGYLSDRFGRQSLVILGLVIFCLGSVVAALSDSITGIIVGRALQGAGAIGSVVMAWMSDLTRVEIRLRAMAIIGISIGFSFGLAFVLGPIFTALWGVPSIFWFTAILAALGILVTFWVAPKAVAAAGIAPKGVQSRINNNFKGLLNLTPGLYKVYFGSLILHASLTALFLIVPQILQNLEIESDQAWQFYLPVFLISVIFTIPFLLYTEKTKCYRRIFWISGVLLFCAEFCIAWGQNSVAGLAVGLCLFFVAFNNLEASLPAYISEVVPAEQKGLSLGIFSTLQFLGLFLGGLLGGVLNAQGGHIAVLGFCVILALAWSVWIFNIKERR